MATGIRSSVGTGWRWLWMAMIITAGCSTPQPGPTPPPTPAPAVDPRIAASAALARGDFREALKLYRAAPAADIDASLRAGLLADDLGEPAATIPPSGADPRQQLLTARRALAAGHATEALPLLEALPTAGFDAYERGLYLRTLGRAQWLNKDPLAASINLTLAERYPLPANRRPELTHLIWDCFTATGPARLEGQLKSDAPHAAGWLALLTITRSKARSATDFGAALVDWQQRFPAHPAHQVLLDELLEQTEDHHTGAHHIALLLPLEGSYAAAGTAIRDGFLAARFGAGAHAAQVSVYHTTAENLASVLGRAQQEGADFIVGPLEKNAVEALLHRTDLTLPVLALNATDQGSPANRAFYQFGLRPEDEAEDAAERAWHDGKRSAIALVPNTELGTRLLRAFTSRWEAQGGQLLQAERFNRSVASYQESVRRVFGLNDSEARAEGLRRALGRPLSFEAHRRDDVDMVFFAAAPSDARQLLPQFRYFGADDVPVYATSLLYEGGRNERADRDLDGVSFDEMPWLLGAGEPALREVLTRYFGNESQASRFRALGADAWRLLDQLSTLRGQPGRTLEGATGTLSVDADGVVHRRLAWAKFTNGVAQPLPH